jgi:MFS family permease
MGHDRDLSLLVGAVGLSALGDWLALVPLLLHLEETTESGIVVALLFVAFWSPAILLAAPAGLLADRYEPRRVLLAVSLAQAAVSIGLAAVSATAAVLLLAVGLGVGFSIAQPAEFALVPGVAGEARLVAANGRVETARYVGFTAGPLLGGLIAAAGGMSMAMLVNAVTFLVVAAVAVVVRPEPAGVHGDAAATGQARDGIVFLVRDRVLAVVMAAAFVSLLFMTASASAEVFFAIDVLGVGDVGYGALIASWTLGMALGASRIARRFGSGTLAVGALAAMAVQGSGIALPTLWLAPAFAFGGYLVGGLAHGAKNVLVRTLMHERVPRELHGRAFAAYNGLRNGAELVALLAGGVLVAAIGARWTLLLAGAVPAVVASGVLLAARGRLRRPYAAAEVATDA